MEDTNEKDPSSRVDQGDEFAATRSQAKIQVGLSLFIAQILGAIQMAKV